MFGGHLQYYFRTLIISFIKTLKRKRLKAKGFLVDHLFTGIEYIIGSLFMLNMRVIGHWF